MKFRNYLNEMVAHHRQGVWHPNSGAFYVLVAIALGYRGGACGRWLGCGGMGRGAHRGNVYMRGAARTRPQRGRTAVWREGEFHHAVAHWWRGGAALDPAKAEPRDCNHAGGANGERDYFRRALHRRGFGAL